MSISDLTSKRDRLMLEAETLLAKSTGPLSQGDSQRFENITSAVAKLDVELAESRAKDAALRAKITEAARLGRTEGPREPSWQIKTTTEPGWGSPTAATRDSALAAVEQSARSVPEAVSDDVVEAMHALIENEARTPAEYRTEAGWTSPKAEWARVVSNPSYVSAFRSFLRDPLGYGDLLDPAERQAMRDARRWDSMRAMSEGSTSVGGAMVPYFLDPSVVLTNSGTVSPIRNLATVKTITTNVWHGVTSNGVTAEWVAEATEVADASPTLAAPSITTYKADAMIQASMELIGDTALSDEIAGLIGDAKSRLEATAFAVGTGSSQPRGIIVASSGNNVSGSSGAANAATLVAADVFAVAEAVPARYRNNRSAWLSSFKVINLLRQLNAGGSVATQSTFLVDFAGDAPAKLVGYGLYEVSDMDSTVVSGSTDDVLLFGDVSQYYIVDRLGLSIAYNPLVLGSNRRPTGESQWVAFWRQGADAVYSGAFRTLRL